MRHQASTSARVAALIMLCAGVVAATGAVLLSAGTAYAAPTCTELQFKEAAELSKGQAQCVEKLQKDGCDAGICSLGLNQCNAELASCQVARNQCANTDLPACTSDLSVCNTDAAVCAASLTQCQEQVAAGEKPRLVDNGDGTITDTETHLMWEKKTDDGSVHDTDGRYSWSSASTVFLDALNNDNFAAHNDWRLPTKSELETILDRTQGNCSAGTGRCIYPAFQPPEVGVRPVWTSTTSESDSSQAWAVWFSNGNVSEYDKDIDGGLQVRAVRGL